MDKSRVHSLLAAFSVVGALSISGLPSLANCGESDCCEAKAPREVKKTENQTGGKVREGFNQPMVLSRLSTVKLVVGDLDQFSQDHGVSKNHLEALLKDELIPTHATICDDGQAGCQPGGKDHKSTGKTADKSCAVDGTPLVYLKVRTIPEGQGSKTAAFNVNLSLVEKVKVPRNKQELMVAVWTRETTGRVEANVQEEIDAQVKDVMKDFRRDYSLANSADIGHGRKHPVKKENLNVPSTDDQ